MTVDELKKELDKYPKDSWVGIESKIKYSPIEICAPFKIVEKNIESEKYIIFKY